MAFFWHSFGILEISDSIMAMITMTLWYIWKARNKGVFEEALPNSLATTKQINGGILEL